MKIRPAGFVNRLAELVIFAGGEHSPPEAFPSGLGANAQFLALPFLPRLIDAVCFEPIGERFGGIFGEGGVGGPLAGGPARRFSVMETDGSQQLLTVRATVELER